MPQLYLLDRDWIEIDFSPQSSENNGTNCAQIGQDSKVFHLRARDFNAIPIKTIKDLNL